MSSKKKFLSLLLCVASMSFLSVGLAGCKKPVNKPDSSDVVITDEEKTLEFSVSEKELDIYSTFQLRVNQANGVIYESSDDSIVSVDANGLVYAKKFGVATITAKCGELEAYCTITVVGQSVVPSIQVSQDEIFLTWSKANQTGSSFDIHPQIRFNGAIFTDGEFTFTSSNPAVATVDENGIVTARGYGDAVISVQGSWRDGFDASVLNKNINVSVLPNAGIEFTAEKTVLATEDKEIDGTTYSKQTTFTTKVSLDGEEYVTPITYIIDGDAVVMEGSTIVAKKVGVASIVAQCVVDGVEINSMPLLIEVVAPIVKSSEMKLYNVKENPVYSFADVEGDFVSISINGVSYNDYVTADKSSLYLSDIYESLLGDSFIELATTKYTYQYQVKFVTHIITSGSELKSCLTKDKDATIYAVLKNDISFSVGMFSASSTAFSGVFDGQGYTIDARGTKFASVYGMFGRLKGQLKNFALINATAYGKESTILGERTYEGGSVSNVYVQAKYEENTEKDYSSLDAKGTLYYCGLFNRGFVFENVIVNIQYPKNVTTSYALCGYNSAILVKNSYCYGNALQLAKTDTSMCYQNLTAMLAENIGSLTVKNGFADFWDFDDKTMQLGNLLIEDVVFNDRVESDQAITMDLSGLVSEEIVKICIDGVLVETPSNNQLVLQPSVYAPNVEHAIRIYTVSSIVEQPFIIVMEELSEMTPESKLITKFYKDENTEHGLMVIDDFMEDGNTAYGIESIGGGNSATMYFTLSSEYMAQLFADAEVTGITFDVVLSTGTAKVQRGKNAEDLKVGATSSSGEYFIYTVTLTREHYEKYGKTADMMLRYTGGGSSAFFFIDNLVTRTGELGGDDVGGDVGGDTGETEGTISESKLITELYKDKASYPVETLTTDNSWNGQENVYGISSIKNNSATMYMTVSYAYLQKLFADETTTGISFDIILSVDQKALEINKAAMPEGAFYTILSETVGDVTYYIYRVTMTKAYYSTLTKDITIRYKFWKDADNNTISSGNSTFFYVNNLTLLTGEIEGGEGGNVGGDVEGGEAETVVTLSESKLITGFSKTKGGTDQALVETNVVGDKNDVYGISSITANNSATMYATLSYAYMGELFAMEGVTAITFDVILSVEKKLQLNAADFPDTASYTVVSKTIDSAAYYVYTVTITKAYYDTRTSDVALRYTHNGRDADGNVIFGGNSLCFYVDNLAVVKADA